uniref:(northern house mosquito) hypothetical protein n=1 Tax=Culex pipiens TaxID=7175 RepID=A0A8D8K4H9_CULPI
MGTSWITCWKRSTSSSTRSGCCSCWSSNSANRITMTTRRTFCASFGSLSRCATANRSASPPNHTLSSATSSRRRWSRTNSTRSRASRCWRWRSRRSGCSTPS